uniref:Saposin B-type domain-containing protein n=1 Tax=Caenorhabditis tropicalis TaxID=1561998 RepID=A0A1I7T6G2_9PELO
MDCTEDKHDQAEEEFTVEHPQLFPLMEPIDSGNTFESGPLYYECYETVVTSIAQPQWSPPKQNLEATTEVPMFASCTLCQKVKAKSLTKRVASYDEKVMLALGFCLNKKLSMDECKKLVTRSQPPVCIVHTTEAAHEICKALSIKKTRELLACSPDTLHKLLVIVRALSKHLNSQNFGERMYKVIIRNKINLNEEAVSEENETIEKPPMEFCPRERQLSKPIRRRCAVCSEAKSPHTVKEVASGNEKMIVMIGRYLRGYCTIAAARISSNLVGSIRICHKHFREAIQSIQEALDIRQNNETVTYSQEAMSQLIVIVNELRPLLSTPQFIAVFQEFVTSNQLSIEYDRTYENRNPTNFLQQDSSIEPSNCMN